MWRIPAYPALGYAGKALYTWQPILLQLVPHKLHVEEKYSDWQVQTWIPTEYTITSSYNTTVRPAGSYNMDFFFLTLTRLLHDKTRSTDAWSTCTNASMGQCRSNVFMWQNNTVKPCYNKSYVTRKFAISNNSL